MYTVISILFLCMEAGLVGLLGYRMVKKKAVVDKNSLVYLVPVFLLIYSLYLTATIYQGTSLTFYTLFKLIHETLSMIAMDLNDEILLPLSEAEPWFYAATIGACILSVLTFIFSVFALFGSTIANAIRKHKRFLSGGDIVIGTSASALEYLKKHPTAVLWVESIDKQDYSSLLKQGYAVHKAPLTLQIVSKCLKGKEHHLIVFRDSGYSYSSILSCFEALKAKADKRLFLHIEVDANEMSMVREQYLSEISKNANSFVLPFCRYELMARRFVCEHPITKYIPNDFFRENKTLKDGKAINVVFFGFGKVNYELFKLMATGFQFAREKDGKLCSAPVHYYAYENNGEQLNNEYFIKLLNEYEQLFARSDLPPAEKICDLREIQPMDAHDAKIRKQVRELVHEDSYTYFIISLSDDFKDAAFAHELNNALEAKDHYKIFVRAKEKENRLLNRDDENIVYFGENEEVFLHENIVNDDLMQLAQNVNDLYNDCSKSKWFQLREWQKLPVVEQYSNVNAALSIYFKLYLLGFALKKEAGTGISKEDFEKLCPDAFMKDLGKDRQFFFETRTANVLAFIEHSRWNAYYLLSGYKPLPFKDFTWTRNSKGKDVLQHKNVKNLRHACLTTYEGLDALIEHKHQVIKAASDKKEKDVETVDKNALDSIYRYDYMVIDGLYDALTKLGYSIVKKE
ncbi:MAG: hypothetical protein IJF39_04960 [Clostridia bacterium]|nr:hypothetical protein [Clostridia bacterium]